MTDMTSLGYPQGYHLGLSSVLWTICIAVLTALGVFLYLKARKSDLINVKEMFLSKSLMLISFSIPISLVQVGVFFPDVFLYLFFFGWTFALFFSTIYMYYWEKNLTNIKHISTISSFIGTTIVVIGLIILFLFPDLDISLLDYLCLTALLFASISMSVYIYLIYIFSKNVKGGTNIKVGGVWIGGMVLYVMGLFFDFPPGVKILPVFFTVYCAPIFIIIGITMIVYGVNTLFVQISSFYTQTQRCVVHRGEIGKGNPMYSCPSCGIVYCIPCFNNVIKKDGCWNCGLGITTESEKELIKEYDLELKKADVLKKKPIPKGKQ